MKGQIGTTPNDLHELASAVSAHRPRPPEYSEIVHGSRLIQVFAFVCFAIAILFVSIGAAFIIGGVYTAVTGLAMPYNNLILTTAELGALGLTSLIWAIAWAIVGTLLNMVSALAMAVRDVAKNSFSR
jgi:hypothetical protein